MTRCPCCEAEVLAGACPSCGGTLEEPALSAAPAGSRRRRAARIGLVALALLLPAAVALPAYRSLHARGCEPQGWVDWHLAMRQQCLTPRYVCDNMTTPRLLRDPELAAAYRAGVEAGMAEPIPMLAEMVDRMRHSYGCKPERPAAGAIAPRRGAERPAGPFEAPGSITL